MSLSKLQDREDDVREVSRYAPGNTEQAVVAYLDRRRKQLIAGFWDGASFDATRDRNRIKALNKIALHFGVGTEEGFQLGSISIDPVEKESPEQYCVRLADLLTPEGWHDVLAPKIQELLDRAAEAIIAGDPVEENQALGFEARELLSFLERTDQMGRTARAAIERNIRTTSQPRWGVGPLNIQRAQR